MTIRGTKDDDDLNGTTGDDVFRLGRGGNDTAHGDEGNDIFRMGGALNAGDHIDGGADFDEVRLDGDYSEGIVFNADTITGIERIRLAAGHDYSLTMNDGNVAAKATLTVNAGPLTSDDHFTFDGSAELDGSFIVFGGDGDDTITAGTQDDVIGIGQGGSDTVHGGEGNDHIYIDGAFDAADVVDGGSGSDTAVLLGDYGSRDGIVLPFDITASMLENVETLFLRNGRYVIAIEDGVVASGETLTVDGSHVHIIGLYVDASAESDGHYAFIGGTRDDILSGGAQSDTFDLTGGGLDTVHGGDGDDTITLGAQFDSNANFHTGDHIDGGAGFDTVTLDGDYFAQLLTDSFTNVERLVLSGPHNYTFFGAAGAFTDGQNMEVDGSGLDVSHGLTFVGSGENFGTYTLLGGAGADQLYGGNKDDTIQGGGSGDLLVGNGGNDTFVYAQVSDSTGVHNDSITDIDFSNDLIKVDTGIPNAIDTALTGVFIDADDFNGSLASAVDASGLGAGDAVLVFVDSGEFASRVFLVVDHNGIAGYQADQDYVIDVTGFTGTLATSSFTL